MLTNKQWNSQLPWTVTLKIPARQGNNKWLAYKIFYEWYNQKWNRALKEHSVSYMVCFLKFPYP